MREHVLVCLPGPSRAWQSPRFWTNTARRLELELSASVLVVRQEAAELPVAVRGLFRRAVSVRTETGLRRALMAADREALGSHVLTDFDTAGLSCRAARRAGRKIVFTNGVFDMLHLGHVRLLKAARALGSYLVVGINSDRSARLLKGRARPVVPQFARAELVAAVQGVDLCVIFDQRDPTELLRVVRPAILAKGGEYSLADVVGRDLVVEGGGRVVLIPHVEGWSASEVIARARRGKA
jgi:D-beta-D-heptose 7-phosphate kinase/D-beta-D-heptose 1-phosphate adenosyltransferase